ncbi:uncharacterized protein LOC128982453 [Macrosteles quadrilineatus]|uniref:uncharacterized protein LOC128982453 n=1 Tax=Macrosteles quadrilineatus TaxID=74068 RepID=UPI0023E11EC6|nr:uncharacterized protein LOC128982453 [Macrosteles quadrilineatus]
MYLFFEKGIRGGLTQCATRHAVANNKYTNATTVNNPSTSAGGSRSSNNKRRIENGVSRDGRFAPSTSVSAVDNNNHIYGDYIMYYDANNLYGWAMSQSLPYKDFEWLSRQEIDELVIEDIPADGDVGYVLEVDLEYPRDPRLHDKHRDLPFCPELRKAPRDQLPYADDVLRTYSVGKSAKLMVTLFDKDAYVIHYRALQQAMDNGLRVRRIHRVLRFKQRKWLQPYVAMNTRLRQQAKNKFEVELFKLMVNAVYGMSLQNVRKHINIKLATNPKTYTKYVAKSNFSDRTWYNKDLALLHMKKVRVILDKPVYAGMCILDHSKTWMYGFHYRLQERYGIDRLRLLYIDTDGLIYLIRTVDVYEDMVNHLDDFDTSNYPRDHICYDPTNARVLGKFKDEANGVIISEFIGLMAKLYCFMFLRSDSSEDGVGDGLPPVKRAKGVNRAVVAKGLTVDDYRRCLQEQRVLYTDNDRFQSRHHIIYSVVVSKRSMAPYDDKRYIEEDGVNTLPWGHYKIPAHRAMLLAPEDSNGNSSRCHSRRNIASSPSATMDASDNDVDIEEVD